MHVGCRDQADDLSERVFTLSQDHGYAVKCVTLRGHSDGVVTGLDPTELELPSPLIRAVKKAYDPPFPLIVGQRGKGDVCPVVPCPHRTLHRTAENGLRPSIQVECAINAKSSIDAALLIECGNIEGVETLTRQSGLVVNGPEIQDEGPRNRSHRTLDNHITHQRFNEDPRGVFRPPLKSHSALECHVRDSRQDDDHPIDGGRTIGDGHRLNNVREARPANAQEVFTRLGNGHDLECAVCAHAESAIYPAQRELCQGWVGTGQLAEIDSALQGNSSGIFIAGITQLVAP